MLAPRVPEPETRRRSATSCSGAFCSSRRCASAPDEFKELEVWKIVRLPSQSAAAGPALRSGSARRPLPWSSVSIQPSTYLFLGDGALAGALVHHDRERCSSRQRRPKGSGCNADGPLVPLQVAYARAWPRTSYVDAFNLFYGSLKGTPYRWLAVGALCARCERRPADATTGLSPSTYAVAARRRRARARHR